MPPVRLPRPSQPDERLVEINEAAWPLVMVRIPAVLDAPAIASMFDGMDRILGREARYTAVIDTRPLKRFPTPIERQGIAKGMADRTLLEARYNLGNAVVLSSHAARVVLTAIQWIRRPVCPQHMTATVLDGIDWCCARLKEAHVPLPSTIDSLRAAERLRIA